MKIFAIIVTYNGMRWMERCLNAIHSSTIKIIPIISDNGSTDGTVEFVRKRAPEAIIFQNGRNLGFGQANNVGIRFALNQGCDYILLINQDVYIEPDTIATLLSHSDKQSLLSPFHYNGDGSALDHNFKTGVLYNPLNNKTFVPEGEPYLPSYNVYAVNAAFWMVPSSIFRKVGGFNPLFFHYNEDLNFADRLAYHKVKVMLYSECRILHDREQFGNKKAYEADYIYRQLLWYLCDISHNFIQRVRNGWHLTREKGFTVALFRVFKIYSRIIRSRKEEKRVGATWL